MGLFKRNDNTIVSKPANTKDYVDKKAIESDSYAMSRLINEIRNISQTREYKYAEYDIMSADVIISAALNMYADDSTQVDENTRKVLSVTSDDEHLQKDLEAFLTKIDLENKLRDVAFALGKYGNKYWKIYLTADNRDIDHIEDIEDPGTVLDLYYLGKPVYFAENPDDTHLYKNGDEFDLYDHESFIHFFVHSGDESDTVELLDQSRLDSNGEPIVVKYKILEGEALIESVRVVWRILRALEDSLLAARLAKADYVRIYNIEVGDSSSSDTRLIVNKVKKIFDSSVSMNIRDGSYSATKSPRAWADPVFNSVSNGTGAINVDTIGGDFEVKSLVDIDYFNNQLFAGLRIPKTLMGFEESINGGLSNESTLVQLDIRYGKYVKKIIDSLVAGVTELCNTWLKVHQRDYQLGKFKIVYNAPSSTEELAKVQELLQRVQVVSDLTNTISDTSTGINKVKLIYELIKQFVPYQAFIDKIEPILKDAIDDAEMDIEIQKITKEKQLKELKNPETPAPPVDDSEFGGSSSSSSDADAIDQILNGLEG